MLELLFVLDCKLPYACISADSYQHIDHDICFNAVFTSLERTKSMVDFYNSLIKIYLNGSRKCFLSFVYGFMCGVTLTERNLIYSNYPLEFGIVRPGGKSV